MANTIAVVSVAVVRRRRIGGGVSRGIVIGVITTIARVITTIARVITTIAAVGISVTIAVSRSGECGTNECACGYPEAESEPGTTPTAAAPTAAAPTAAAPTAMAPTAAEAAMETEGPSLSCRGEAWNTCNEQGRCQSDSTQLIHNVSLVGVHPATTVGMQLYCNALLVEVFRPRTSDPGSP